MKTKITRIAAVLLAICLLCCSIPSALAATVQQAQIDVDAECSLTVYKYDLTSALENGVGSYVSTGQVNDTAAAALAPYAIDGVEFTYVRVAQIVTCNEAGDAGFAVRNLYRFDAGERTTALLAALGLTEAQAYRTDSGWLDFAPETLQAALAAQLAANSTVVKNALEALAAAHGTAMPLTDETGKTQATALATGLYLIAETKVPEQVVQTTDPWLVQLPMTTIKGTAWDYAVTVYPKNTTGDPTLNKTLRESKTDGGKNNATDSITDGFAHAATASEGDTIEYQVISNLPVITSNATALTAYTFRDTLDKGLAYKGNDVVLAFYADSACTEQITKWTEGDGHYTVTRDANGMTIAMTAAGLSKINSGVAVHGDASTQRGYSGCTLRITYGCTVTADAVLGDEGNDNSVTLTWKRTNTDKSATLTSDAHLYSYGLQIAKRFTTEGGDPSKVEFVLKNKTDGIFVVASGSNGAYNVTGHTREEVEATRISPNVDGSLAIKGLEDDEYLLTEVTTDEGYQLLAEAISFTVAANDSTVSCTTCGTAHLTAAAKLGELETVMGSDGESAAAYVSLTIANNPIPTIPPTGESGMIFVFGATALGSLCAVLLVVALVSKKRKAA